MIAWLLKRKPVALSVLQRALPVVDASDEATATTTAASAEIKARFLGIATGSHVAAEDDEGMGGKAIRRFSELCSTDHFDVSHLPRLPAVLPELLSHLRGGRFNSRQLAPLIERDSVLFGEVMRLAGSAHYRSRHAVANLPQAIVLLGEDGLRRVVVNALAKPIYRHEGGRFARTAADQFAAHADHCADICVQLQRGRGDLFEAHLAGIFAHAGAMPIMRILDQHPDLAHELRGRAWAPAFEQCCAALSAIAAAHWKLPPRVIVAIGECGDHIERTSGRSVLGRALIRADLDAKAALLRDHGLLAPDAKI